MNKKHIIITLIIVAVVLVGAIFTLAGVTTPVFADKKDFCNIELGGPLYAPPQQNFPGPGWTFNNQYVVVLQCKVDSKDFASKFDATHDFYFLNLGSNVNLWTGPSGVNPDEYAEKLRKNPKVLNAYPAYEPGTAVWPGESPGEVIEIK